MGLSEKFEISMLQVGIVVLFYGLYFGCLGSSMFCLCTGRDLVMIISQTMAKRVGYFSASGDLPKKSLGEDMCSICGVKVYI